MKTLSRDSGDRDTGAERLRGRDSVRETQGQTPGDRRKDRDSETEMQRCRDRGAETQRQRLINRDAETQRQWPRDAEIEM